MSFSEILKNIQCNKRITGQLFFRFMGPSIELDLTDREMFAVAGNLAVPKGLIKTENQHAIAGYKTNITGEIIIGLDMKNVVDFKDKFHGTTVGSTLLEPIWRI
jgi:hypothetical protein